VTGIGLRIANDFTGFVDYITAHNVKNKIKHPLFLADLFSKCAKLYFNTKFFDTLETGYEIKIIQELNTALLEIEAHNYTKHKGSLTRCSKLLNKKFIFFIEAPEQEGGDSKLFKIISDHLIQLNHDQLYLTVSKRSIPAYFQCVSWPSISKIYTKCYPTLLKYKETHYSPNNKDNQTLVDQSMEKKLDVDFSGNFQHRVKEDNYAEKSPTLKKEILEDDSQKQEMEEGSSIPVKIETITIKEESGSTDPLIQDLIEHRDPNNELLMSMVNPLFYTSESSVSLSLMRTLQYLELVKLINLRQTT
jgi:hypothetical protein